VTDPVVRTVSGRVVRPPGWLAVAATSAGTELRRWRRQRVAVATSLVLPLAMAALISLALGGDLSSFSTTFAVVDRDHGPAAASFVGDALGSAAVERVVHVQRVGTQNEARRMLRAGDADAILILPSGMSEAIAAGRASGIELVRDDAKSVDGDLAALLVDQFGIRARAATLTARDGRRTPTGPWPLEVRMTAPGGSQLDAPTHYGPALGMFFVLVTMGFVASSLVADRQRGVVERLASTPVPPSALLLGRAMAAVTVGGLSMAIVALSMRVLFGRSWGPPGPVVVVTVAVVLAIAGVAALISAVARTPAQAQSLSLAVAFAFALLSGSFAPPGAAARPLLAGLSPTTHALDAYATLTTEHSGLAAIAPSLVALVGIAAAGALLAAVFGRRILR
jgi:ABC-2 type transport system permease protein